MKRFLAIIIAFALAATMLAACGDSGNGTHVNPDAKGDIGGEADNSADNSADNQLPVDDGQSTAQDLPIDDVTEPEVTEPEVTEPEVTDDVPQEEEFDFSALSIEEYNVLYITHEAWNYILDVKEDYGEELLPYHTREEDFKKIYERYFSDEVSFRAAIALLANHVNDFITAVGPDGLSGYSEIDLPYPGGIKAYLGEFETYRKEYEDLIATWYTDYTFDNGTLTISGIGEMERIDLGNQKNLVEKVVIEPGITRIADEAFSYCENLTSVTIPDTVTDIGRYAFSCCKKLTNITIPNTVTGIGDGAFYCCVKLTDITIPNNVTNIGEKAFSSCGMTDITIPDGVISIGNSAFSYCYDLKSITIPDSVISIGYEAFNCCKNLTSVTIPDNIVYLGSDAFASCINLTSITIPGSTDCIYYKTFYWCKKLTNVTIKEGVTVIGDNAFSDCNNLTTVTIPASVTVIDYGAFSGCDNLTDIYFGGTAAEWNQLIKDTNTGIPPLTCKIHYESTGPAN